MVFLVLKWYARTRGNDREELQTISNSLRASEPPNAYQYRPGIDSGSHSIYTDKIDLSAHDSVFLTNIPFNFM